MQELLEMYTDEELMKYYSLLTPLGRSARRVIFAIIQKIDDIDENAELTEIVQLYEKLKLIFPKEFSSKLEKSIREGHTLEINSTNGENMILIQSYKLFSVYYSRMQEKGEQTS